MNEGKYFIGAIITIISLELISYTSIISLINLINDFRLYFSFF